MLTRRASMRVDWAPGESAGVDPLFGALGTPTLCRWQEMRHSRRCGPRASAAACPLLPESDSQPPKCVPSLRAKNRSERPHSITSGRPSSGIVVPSDLQTSSNPIARECK
jgi:hypothetical protein